AISINDNETKQTIIEAFNEYKLLLEPHGAVGWAGLKKYLQDHKEDNNPDQLCISLETAHPAKFPEQIRELLAFDPDLPPSLEGIEQKEESYVSVNKDYGKFKEYLIMNY
ncbi:threonine synthase, partial [Bacteroidota bacterium]